MIKLQEILNEKQLGKRLVIFDFDDTLATSESYIYITKADGTKLTLDPAEYAKYEEEPGDKFDWKDFNSMLKNPQTIDRNMNMLKKAMANAQNKVTILTARAQGRGRGEPCGGSGVGGGDVARRTGRAPGGEGPPR